MASKRPGIFMRNEIKEQPEAVNRTLKESINEVREASGFLNDLFIYTTGSGSSFHASLVLSRALSKIAGLRSASIQASELPDWIPSEVRDAALIAFSQSGESRDVLIAVESFKKVSPSSPVIAVTNTPGSTLSRISDATIITRAGEERAIAATKTYTTQLAVSYLLSMELAEIRGKDTSAFRYELERTPELMRETMRSVEEAVNLHARDLKDREFGFVLGKGPNYATALESALKLRETANLHYVGYSAREFLHGPIQLLSRGTPVIMIFRSEAEDVAQRVKALGGEILSVDVGGEFSIPEVDHELSPLITVLPMQMLSLEVSILRGLDPDRPEKLSKVVR